MIRVPAPLRGNFKLMDDYITLRGHAIVLWCRRAVISDFSKMFLGTYEFKMKSAVFLECFSLYLRCCCLMKKIGLCYIEVYLDM